MDGKYSWKRTEDIEIDLIDLLCRLCRQWKRVAVCAMVSAVVLGGYGWLRGIDRSDTDKSEISEETEMTEAEEQAVMDAVWLKQENRELEKYLDNSILMQIDPYHKARHVMLYCIDSAVREELPGITESYLNFVLNGGAEDALIKSGDSWEMDKSYLAEVITAYQKTYSFPYQAVLNSREDSNQNEESVFYVEITGMNAGEAEKMALDIQEILKEYSAKVKKKAGEHRLTLVSTAASITADSGLQSLQKEKKALVSSNRTNLKTMTDAFSREQMAAYKNETGLENEEGREETGIAEPGENSISVIKYVLIGFIGGVIAYCSIYLCWYIFGDTVKSMEEMKRLYTFPFYGGITMEGNGGKSVRIVSVAGRDAFGHGKTQVLNRIRLACKKQGMTALCAASAFALNEQEKECLESIARQLKDKKIDVSIVENVSADTAVWDKLAETGNVLMVCRINTTTHQMIDDAMSFYMQNDIAVTGAIAFL